MSVKNAWNTIEELVQYEEEEWDDPIFSKKGTLDYGNANMEQILESMEYQVDLLMKDAVSLVGKSENLCGILSNEGGYMSPELPHQEAFEGLVMNFILDQLQKQFDLYSKTEGGKIGTAIALQNALIVINETTLLLFWPTIRDGEFRTRSVIDSFPGQETDYPPFGNTGHMPPGYDYRNDTAPDGSS
ncbi:hypothetical protein Tco_0373359 [Tanacetum coccineum]